MPSRIETFKTSLRPKEDFNDSYRTEQEITKLIEKGWVVKDVSVVSYQMPTINGGVSAHIERYVTLIWPLYNEPHE